MAGSDEGSRSRRNSHYNQQRSSLRSDRSAKTPPRPQSGGPHSRPLSRTPSSQLLHEVDDFTLLDSSDVPLPPKFISAPSSPSPSQQPEDDEHAPWPLVPRIPQRKGSLEKGKRTSGTSGGTASRHGSRGSMTRTGSRGRNIDELLVRDQWANLNEVDGPPPVQNPYERSRYHHHTLEEERTESRSSRWQRSRSSHQPSMFGGRGTPATDLDVTALPDIADNRYRRDEATFSQVATELYAISYLILFSILGTLARLGLQWLTFYPGAPLAFSELWANVGGTFFMGFLSEDRRVFRSEWGNPRAITPQPFRRSGGEKTSEEHDRAGKAQHTKVKKTIPLYIGLTTGFCGSFTSFSSFMRDTFLAFLNDLPNPVPSSPTPPRNGGYSFMAGLAVIILTLSACFAALKVGAHVAILLDPITPTLPFRFTRRFLDPLVVFLAWAAWLGAIFMAIWPPDRPGGPASKSSSNADETWRGQAIFACIFAPFGCLLRFYISVLLNPLTASFPLGTFTVNIFGTAVLAMAYDLQHVAIGSAGAGGGRIGCQVLQGLMDGFCGALTTVSTWMLEIEGLRRAHAYVYAGASVGVGTCVCLAVMGSVRWSVGWTAVACVV